MSNISYINSIEQAVFNQELAMQLIESTEDFPVDFDVAWQWIEYSRKDSAKRHFLQSNFLKGIDYNIFHTTVENSNGGRPTENILLSVECFKMWCMMANTQQGLLVRKYFLECEKIAKQKVYSLSPGEILMMQAKAIMALEKEHAELKLAQALTDAKAEQALLASAENTKALADLKTALVSLQNTVAKFSTANSIQTKKNLLNEFIQHMGGLLSIKHSITVAEGIRTAWTNLGLKMRNSVYKFDLNSRIAQEKKAFKEKEEAWKKSGSPRGQKPKEITRPMLLENTQKLEAALECCTVLANEVIV
jgi:phage anti-repressor protein